MDLILALGIILVISALSCKPMGRAGLPILVGFILIGIFIGNWFAFESLDAVEQICNFALLLIIFTGGFQTNFAEARPVLAISSVLSAAGTVFTAGLVGSFAFFVLGMDLYQALLLGAVISSTDAASVFSVLNSKQMDLKHNLNSVLELESGSNDPFAHMMTMLLITLAAGGEQNTLLMLALQLSVAALSGFVCAKLGQWLINKLNVEIDGIYAVLLCGAAFLAYGAANQFGGNGFLAVYITGIILGNGKLVYKRFLSRLYNAFSMLMQILLFIVLGILCIPNFIPAAIVSGLLVAVFLIAVARPAVMFALMIPFGRPLNEIALVSWAGFRGASSIVFATHLLTAGLPYAEYIFSIVFFVCMLSVIVQGSFIVPIAKLLKLIDH